ncbi:hypothetical protein JHK87_040160 [Glycine soja]|nr:hypothetical protein JHK87_040160 [Glycine soja]
MRMTIIRGVSEDAHYGLVRKMSQLIASKPFRNVAASPKPTPVQVNPEPADPQSSGVNPPSSPKLEAVPPSPPLIIISNTSSDEAATPPDSPDVETVDPPASPIGGIADLSNSSSGEVVALTNSPV